MVDFALSDEQRGIRDLAREFAAEIAPVAVGYDCSGDYPRDVARKAFEVGLLNLSIPQEFQVVLVCAPPGGSG